MSKSWEAGVQDTIKQWVLNAELTVSGESGGWKAPSFHGARRICCCPHPHCSSWPAWAGAVPSAEPVPATSGAPWGRPRPSGCAGGRGGARRPRARPAERGGSRWRAGGSEAAGARPPWPEHQLPSLPSSPAPDAYQTCALAGAPAEPASPPCLTGLWGLSCLGSQGQCSAASSGAWPEPSSPFCAWGSSPYGTTRACPHRVCGRPPG